MTAKPHLNRDHVRHLLGQMLPQLTLESSQASVSVRALSMNRLVLYIYPRTGVPGQEPLDGWDAIPGARENLKKTKKDSLYNVLNRSISPSMTSRPPAEEKERIRRSTNSAGTSSIFFTPAFVSTNLICSPRLTSRVLGANVMTPSVSSRWTALR